MSMGVGLSAEEALSSRGSVIADIPRAELGLFFREHPVELTPHTDSKSGFEEHKTQTETAEEQHVFVLETEEAHSQAGNERHAKTE